VRARLWLVLQVVSWIVMIAGMLAPEVTAASTGGSNLTPVLLTPVDMDCSPGATENSNKQQLVANEKGIFLAYYWRDDPTFEKSSFWSKGFWRLVRSIDGGKTFSLIYTSPSLGAGCPDVETDENNNILVATIDITASSLPFYLYRFSPEDDYQNPRVTVIKGDASGKDCMFYDRDAGKVYLFNHHGILLVINGTTGKRIRRKMFAYPQGLHARIEYPLVYVEDGVLYHAWTTQNINKYLYWDIHFAESPDGGSTWYKADGSKLKTPFVPDDTGPTDEIALKEEFHDFTWLCSMIVKNGKAHFVYFSDVGSRHYVYVRMDLDTGKIEKRVEPSGETLRVNGNGGFFVTGPGSSPLYIVSTNSTNICALVSYDNGDTWHDAAVSEKLEGYIEYTEGYRELCPEGILGSFTTYNPATKTNAAYFFRIPVPEGGAHLLAILFLLAIFRMPRLEGRQTAS